MSYIGQELGQGRAARETFTATGGETSVNTNYTPGQLSVYLNGVKLVDTIDFTATNGTSITGLTALAASDVMDFVALENFLVSNTVEATGGTFLGVVTLPSPVINTGVSGSAILDSDAMSGVSATKLSSSESIKAYVDAQSHTAEGTAVLSTGETGGTKFLREDGDATCSWQTAGSPSITDNGNAVAITIDTSEDCTFAGNLFPTTDNAKDLGSAAKRWQNIYTTDLHLANDRGNWTVIEEEDYLTIRNNKTNKVYKLVMEEIE